MTPTKIIDKTRALKQNEPRFESVSLMLECLHKKIIKMDGIQLVMISIIFIIILYSISLLIKKNNEKYRKLEKFWYKKPLPILGNLLEFLPYLLRGESFDEGES